MFTNDSKKATGDVLMKAPILRTAKVVKTIKYWDCMSKFGRCKTHHQTEHGALTCLKRNSEPYEIFINDEPRMERNADIFDRVVRRGETMASVGRLYDLHPTSIANVIHRRVRSTVRAHCFSIKDIRKLYADPDAVDAAIMSHHSGWLSSKRQNPYWTMRGAHKSLAFIGVGPRCNNMKGQSNG